MIRLKPNITFDFNTGETFTVTDNTGIYDATVNPTGYGAPNIEASDVTATRMIFGNYITETRPQSAATSIEAGVEYHAVGTGSFVYDTKTVLAGETFIFQSTDSVTLPSTLIIVPTGRFNPVINFVPTDVTTGDFTPSLLGDTNTVFADSIYNLQYDVFTTKYLASESFGAGTYIVSGDIGTIIAVDSVEYRVGEVFIVGSTESFTVIEGDNAFVSKFYQTVTDANGDADFVYFLCGYYAWQAIVDTQNRLANGCCNCKDKIQSNLVRMWNNWVAILDQLSVIDGVIDLSGCQILLYEIVSLSLDIDC